MKEKFAPAVRFSRPVQIAEWDVSSAQMLDAMSANRSFIRSDRNPPARCRLAAAALLLFAFAGCRSAGPTAHLNPIDPNYTLPPAETLDYPGPERFWNKAGLVISPARIVAQVGSEVPMFAGICDGNGHLAPHEQVEWMLDNGGVGSFVSVSDPIRPFCLELVSTKSRKVDNMYALTETSPANVILTRGTATLNDDTVMPRGYTWVTVTSPVEGSSYVTAFGPDVYSWDVRQKSARIIWIDADWCFPEGACAKVGEPVTLVTSVFRRTTKAPVSDWIVKYTITGGVAAGFGPENAQSVEIATEEDGRACVDVIPAADANGSVCVNVELIRSECATPGSPERLSIATAATQVTWGIPDPPSPPPSAPGPPAAPAAPPETPQPSIPPTAPPVPPPPAATPAPPQVGLSIRGPQTALLMQDIEFGIDVKNNGTTQLTDLVLTGKFDDGLKHEKAVGQFDPRKVGIVEPGQSVSFPMKFRAVKAGKHCVTIGLTDSQNLGRTPFETQQACVTVTDDRPPSPPQAALGVDINGPPSAVAGQNALFTVVVENRADTAANNVRINVEFDPALQAAGIIPSDLADAAKSQTGGYVWTIASIGPRAKVTRTFGCKGSAATPRAYVNVKVFDAANQPYFVDKFIEIQPSPVAAQGPIKVEVAGNANPVKVGSNVTYLVTITNVSQNNDEKQVRLTLTLPEEMTRVGEPVFNARGENIDGRTIQFDPILVLRAGEPITCKLVLRADRAGQANLRADVTSNNVLTAATATSVTRIDPP